MPSDHELTDFLHSTFGSIWSLETLLLISSDPSHRWSTAELVSLLRASDLVVARSIEELGAAGLIVAEKHDCVRYAPASPGLQTLVMATRRRYTRSPAKVRRLIVGRGGAARRPLPTSTP